MAVNGRATYLGVTPPISTDLPSERHKQISESLIAELRAMNQFEGPEDARLREVVLIKLNQIIKDFVYRVSIMRRFSEQQAREAGGKIFTFGSYRLGVHGPGADIDTLAVVPGHITRQDFFDTLEPILKARSEVTDCTGVREAWVPVIKLKFSGVEIDLLFAALAAMSTIPDDLELYDNNLLRGLDEPTIRSLNGSRVTDEILRLVPNVAVFRDATRTIKLWAKRRAIYSNVMGFLGGVVWAMLVARICQLYPNECAGGIISKFFVILHQWNWPTPIMLKPIEEGPLHVRVWNPHIYPPDRAHRMPVITPAYPAGCATHNVSISTQAIMTKEFKRAADIVDKIVVRSASWSELFSPHDFFQKYRFYLQITASSVDSDVQLKWSGTVESKIRHLVKQLEYVETLTLAHPYVDSFDRVNYCLTLEESHVVMTGELPPNVYERKKEEYEDKKDILKVHTTSFFIGLLVEPKDPNSKAARKLDIAYPTSEFYKIVKAWENFEQDKMGIVIRYVKSSALPPYIGHVQQNKPKTKSLKRVKGADRATSEVVNEAGAAAGSPAKRLRASSPTSEIPPTVPLSSADIPASTATSAPDTPQTESARRALQNLSSDAGNATPPAIFAAESLNGTALHNAGQLDEAVQNQQEKEAQQRAEASEQQDLPGINTTANGENRQTPIDVKS